MKNKMKFCDSCGTEIYYKAKICPQCHSKQKLHGIRKVLDIGLAVIVVILIISMYHALSNYNRYSKNRGKGGDDPEMLAKIWITAVSENNPDLLDDYLDAYIGNNNVLKQEVTELNVEMKNAGFKDVNLSGVTYEVGTEYEDDGYTYIDINIQFAETGLLGGNSVLGNTGRVVLTLHKRDTPDGEKWFYGSIQ